MPVFDFRCEDCGAQSEIFVRGSAKPVCEQCQSSKLEKLMSAPAGHVAGSGASLPMMNSPCAGMPGPSCGAPHCGRIG